MPKLVILLSGYKRSGKNYCADLLVEQLTDNRLTVNTLAFAAPMKRIIATIFGITLDELDDYKNGNNRFFVHTDDSNHRRNLHTTDFRSILQKFGSEAMKPEFGDDVWGSLMRKQLLASTADVVIITDYRFDSELNFLLQSGFSCMTVHIDASMSQSDDTHISEVLPTSVPDFTIDNRSQDQSIHDEVARCITAIKAQL